MHGSTELSSTVIVLIRHAHTANNGGPAATLSGRTDLPLSARGRAELQHLSRRRPGSPFDAVYSSPLQRARETAAALVETSSLSIRVCPALQEIDCGLLEGRPLDQVRRDFAGLWAANQRQDDEWFRWPGGESYREFRARCLHAIRLVAQAHPDGRVGVVTHAGVISQVLGFLSGASPARWGAARPGTASLTELEWTRGGNGRVVRFDDRSHLPPELG